MTDYARLRALAEAAHSDAAPEGSRDPKAWAAYLRAVGLFQQAADPTTLIALLDRLEELEGREPEWEYVPSSGLFQPSTDRFQFDCAPSDLVRRRKAGEWEPVEGGSDE